MRIVEKETLVHILKGGGVSLIALWLIVWCGTVHIELYSTIIQGRKLVEKGRITTATILQKFRESSYPGHFRSGNRRCLNFIIYQFRDTRGVVWEEKKEIKNSALWKRIQQHATLRIRYLEMQPSHSNVLENPLFSKEEKIYISIGAIWDIR